MGRMSARMMRVRPVIGATIITMVVVVVRHGNLGRVSVRRMILSVHARARHVQPPSWRSPAWKLSGVIWSRARKILGGGSTKMPHRRIFGGKSVGGPRILCSHARWRHGRASWRGPVLNRSCVSQRRCSSQGWGVQRTAVDSTKSVVSREKLIRRRIKYKRSESCRWRALESKRYRRLIRMLLGQQLQLLLIVPVFRAGEWRRGGIGVRSSLRRQRLITKGCSRVSRNRRPGKMGRLLVDDAEGIIFEGNPAAKMIRVLVECSLPKRVRGGERLRDGWMATVLKDGVPEEFEELSGEVEDHGWRRSCGFGSENIVNEARRRRG
jgi:hypothetical protein